EAYFTASQTQLIWARFKKNRAALVAGSVLILLMLMGVFAPFLSPYDPTIAGRDKDYQNGAPQIPMFCDHNGCSWRLFLHGLERTRSIKTNFRWVTAINVEERRYVTFLPTGWEYRLFAFDIDLPGTALDVSIPGFKFSTHLFGIDNGGIHIFGTDSSGKDIYSRTLHAVYTSLAVGTIGVLISFVLALIIGGVSGYFGGMIDGALQMLTDAVRTVPAIPLFMALAAFIPDEWSSEMRFFFISIILGFIGWPTLARRVRTHLLSERNQEYVLAAQLCGASANHIIRRHLLPSFTSHLVASLTLSIPGMILAETALSFLGLGLQPPVVSWGVLLQDAQNIRTVATAPWLLLPTVAVVIAVLSLNFVGDGLRDAADPYKQ
ncbi:MAG: ABC transporter permease, partial [bacterium]|nr:ABC transporter permease [bacterium]